MIQILWMTTNILTGIGLYVILRCIPCVKASNIEVLSINYLTAGTCCFISSSNIISTPNSGVRDMLFPAIALGLIFIISFWAISFSSNRIGIGITTIASKMSVIIPAFVGIFAFGQTNGLIMKFIGLALALCSFALIFIQKKQGEEKKPAFLLLLLVFVMTGLSDTGIDTGNNLFIPAPEQSYLFFMITFFSAAIVGNIVVIYDIQHKKKRLSLASIILGILLGLSNFLYTISIMKNLDNLGSSVVFPILNIAIVLGTVFIGIIFFKERLSKLQWGGIICGSLAVLIIALS